MKTKEQVIKKIEELEIQFEELHDQRNEVRNPEYEEYQDILKDIITVADRIEILNWVISK